MKKVLLVLLPFLILISFFLFYIFSKRILVYSNDKNISVRVVNNIQLRELVGNPFAEKPYFVIINVIGNIPKGNNFSLYMPPDDNSKAIPIACNWNEYSAGRIVKVDLYIDNLLIIENIKANIVTDIYHRADYFVLTCIDSAIHGKFDEGRLEKIKKTISQNEVVFINVTK